MAVKDGLFARMWFDQIKKYMLNTAKKANLSWLLNFTD
jgi:hypothetical protein